MSKMSLSSKFIYIDVRFFLSKKNLAEMTFIIITKKNAKIRTLILVLELLSSEIKERIFNF